MGQLILSMGLVWREVRILAQRAPPPQARDFFLLYLPHMCWLFIICVVYMLPVLFIFFSSVINLVMEIQNMHLFLGPLGTTVMWSMCIWCINSQFRFNFFLPDSLLFSSLTSLTYSLTPYTHFNNFLPLFTISFTLSNSFTLSLTQILIQLFTLFLPAKPFCSLLSITYSLHPSVP
jgi:hypothetical protein